MDQEARPAIPMTGKLRTSNRAAMRNTIANPDVPSKRAVLFQLLVSTELCSFRKAECPNRDDSYAGLFVRQEAEPENEALFLACINNVDTIAKYNVHRGLSSRR